MSERGNRQRRSFRVSMITISGLVLALSFLSINTRNFVLASVAFVRHTSRVGAAIPSNLQGEKELPEAIAHLLRIRGGESTALDDDDEEDDYSEEEEDDEELDASLAASAVKATVKGKKKQTNSKIKKAKSAVNKELAAKATKTEKVAAKKKHKSSSTFRVPYIIRACLNPMTIVKMTTAYWASLFKLDYLKQDSSQELRSALEEKAKRQQPGAGGSKRGRKKMKRGQAKTLSDLPQLNT